MFLYSTRLRFLLPGVLLACVSAAAAAQNILPPPPTPIISASTVPPSGDLNPYGVAYVPDGFPSDSPLAPSDIVVSNFNNSANIQGTGSTVMQISQSTGMASVFFQGTSGLGLTTALGVLRGGFVVVGSVPTTDGACDTINQGALLILDRNGNLVETLTDLTLLDGPWDLTINDMGSKAQIFVSNVLNGTVTRLDVSVGSTVTVDSMTRIASGYRIDCNAAAVVVGPTGLALDSMRNILYVASTDDNAIFAVPNASRTRNHGRGRLVYRDQVHLHGPLALALAPNGHLLTANGDAINPDPNQSSEIVEFTTTGMFVSQFQVDPVPGSAFGLALFSSNDAILFAAVDDNTSMLEEWSESRTIE